MSDMTAEWSLGLLIEMARMGKDEYAAAGGWERVEKLADTIRQSLSQRVPDVDWLSNVIREIDGNNSMGAGALAEAIVDEMRKLP